MSNQWSDNLRKRMETHQEPSPEGLWTDIEQIIKQESSIQAQPKQRKSLLWSKRIAAAAAAILVVLFIGDYFIIDNSQEQQVITQEVQISHEPENDVPTYKKDDSQSINSNNHKKTLSYTKKHIASSEIGGSIDSNNENKAIDKSVQKEDTKKDDFTKALDTEKNTEQKTENKQQNPKKQNYGYSNGVSIENNIPIIKEKYNSAKWTTGIYASNISSNSTKKNEGYGSLTSKMILSEEDQVPIVGDNPPSDILLQNKYREVYTDIKHRQPIIIGVSASYNIDDRWSLTSGLTYTILSSQLRSGSDNYYYTSEQTLHNVGIPLNINYNIWKTKKASVYLSAGGMMEKNVSGKLKTEYIVDNQRKSNQEDKISIDQLQWSLNAAVGVQYNFSSKVGLYAEPGTSYYFKNSSDVETIYKEKQLNLSLRFGLRFSLAE